MAAPNTVRVKRMRDEPAPDTLIVERQQKRSLTANTAQHMRYVRQTDALYDLDKVAEHAAEEGRSRINPTSLPPHPQETNRSESKSERRTFYLSHTGLAGGAVQPLKRGRQNEGIATFVERTRERAASNLLRATSNEEGTDSNDRPLKRPSRGAALKSGTARWNEMQGRQVREHDQALLNELHQMALDEVAKAAKPKVIAMPRLSGARSRELHRQRMALQEQQSRDHDMTDGEEADYVYETYILAASAAPDSLDGDTNHGLGDIGYLVITEKDLDAWETYLQDDDAVEDDDTDDEDENAEDHYGADYPDDELASDDEFNRDAYAFRKHGDSDNEEWNDDDAATYSDDEDYTDRPVNLWKKTPAQFAEYLRRQQDVEGGE